MKEYQDTLGLINEIWESMKKTVIKGYKEDSRIYTSWTASGEGKEEISWLKIVSVLMLSDD